MAELKDNEKEYLDYLFDQYKKGYSDSIVKQKLIQHGYIQLDAPTPKKNYEYNPERLTSMYNLKYRRKIYKHEWLPESTVKHSDEFFLWINSITYGYFPNKTEYEKFDLYKAQAYKWLGDKISIADISDEDLATEVIKEEYRRCDENTLYFADKYGIIKEGDTTGGTMRYTAKEHNAFIYYLLDCGYSLMIGKPRQIFSSTQIGLFALKKCVLQTNFYMKFVTEDDKTGLEIFNDKIKFPYTELPDWMKPSVISDRENKFWLGMKNKKGEIEPPNSRIEVVAPSPTAINGGSPQLVMIDEIGNIPILSEMMTEARPTMFVDKNSDGNLVMKRQIICWGTGVSDKKGKGAYKSEWDALLNLWEERNDRCGLIPVFLSWHVRCNEDHYKAEREVYYSGKKGNELGLEDRKVMFHQHYPSTFNDMFTSSSGKLIPSEKINEGLKRIRENRKDIPITYGYFEPIYDFSVKEGENSDTPYKIRDARFVACDDTNLDMATSIMIVPPNKEWRNRYYQGTDPISVETGKSLMASIIHDAYLNMPVCMVNYKKTHDHKYVFLQCLLMGLYYDVEHNAGDKLGVKELVESNVGTNYVDYKEAKGFIRNMVHNTELPDPARGGGGRIGMDNRGTRSLFIIGKLREYVNTYDENIYFDVIYRQLDTFVDNQKNKVESWGSVNKKLYPDDVLFALAFAYICRLTYPYKNPEKISEEGVAVKKVRYELTRKPDGTLTRIPKAV